jgi:hypothetical protein
VTPKKPAPAVLALLPLLAACASANAIPEEEPGLAGCFQFEQPAGERELGLPWGVELLDEALEGWPAFPDAFRARSWLTQEQSADHPFGYWIRLEGEYIRTGHPGGGGFDLVLAVPEGGTDLLGHGQAVGDALRPGDDGELPIPARVIARRVDCPGG